MLATWWQSLGTVELLLLYLAVPSTVILLLQTLLLAFGGLAGGDSDAGGPCEGDGIPDLDGDLPDDGADMAEAHEAVPENGTALEHSEGTHVLSGLHILTVRGVIAFLTLFGWSGLAFCQTGMPSLLALFLAVPVGLAGMVAIALILREAMRLQYDGTLNPGNAVGLMGTVYLTVPAARGGTGKVNVLVQSQLREFEAVTDGANPIPTGAEIRVTGLAEGDALLVEEKR